MKQIDLLNGPIDSTLRKFALPLAVSFIVNLLYAWIDLFFVSKLGPEAVASLGISERIWFFTFAVGSGFAIGSGIIIARRIGEGRNETIANTAFQSIVIMFFFGVLLAGLLNSFINEIQYILGIKSKIKELSGYYFSSLVWGIPFNFILFQVSAIIRSAGNSSYPMYMLLLSNIVNIILTPIFMFGLGVVEPMGIFGAGLGTSISFLVASLYGLYILFFKFSMFKLNRINIKFDKEIIVKISVLGVPASLQMIAISLTSIGLAANANVFGTEILSTFIIGLRVDLLVAMSIFAFGASMEIISGQNIGAGNIERIFLYQKSAIKQLSILLTIFGIFVFFFGNYIGMLFTDNEIITQEVGLYLKFAAFGYIPFAVGIIAIRTISGAGDYMRSLKIVIFSLVLFQLPGSYLLSNYLDDKVGIWISVLFSMLIFSIYGYLQVKQRAWAKIEI